MEDGFRGTLDLAACPRRSTPEAQIRPVAMISDGTAEYAQLPVRERCRLRPEQFEQLGWHYIVLWTIDVFTDPASTTERVAEKVGLAAGPEFAQSGRGPLSSTTGPVRFGGAADAEDEEAERRHKQWLAPQQRRLRNDGAP